MLTISNKLVALVWAYVGSEKSVSKEQSRHTDPTQIPESNHRRCDDDALRRTDRG